MYKIYTQSLQQLSKPHLSRQYSLLHLQIRMVDPVSCLSSSPRMTGHKRRHVNVLVSVLRSLSDGIE